MKNDIRNILKQVKWFLLSLALIFGLIGAYRFVRPFDVPEFVEIDTSESAFLIPLEGDLHDQSAFQSVEYLLQRKIASKRVQITHRWKQTGYMPASGEWIPTVKLIKLDRRPITREWTASNHTGTSQKNEAIHSESRDSVNFTVGITCTASIPEEQSATFLYSYPTKSLADMMDTEVRARIQQVISDESANYDLAIMIGKKNEIMKAVREDVIGFFKSKGIAVSTVAMVGGFAFESQEIQRTIDDAAKASQLKITALARKEAQEVENQTLKLAAEGKAEAARLAAQGEAQAAYYKAETEAKSKKLTAQVLAENAKLLADSMAYELEKAKGDPLAYFQLKAMEAELQKLKTWDGKYPNYLIQMTGSGKEGLASNFFIQPPVLPEAPKPASKVDAVSKKE